jgi:hypothetical protein
LDLNITQSTSDTISISSCSDYVWNGNTYSNSGVYQGTTNNCVTDYLNLTIVTVDVSTSVSGMTLSANNTTMGTTYQWVDCDNNNAPIQGAVNQFFTATDPGNYAVVITQGNCVQTSACISVTDASILENEQPYMRVYPNPSNDLLYLESMFTNPTNFQVMDGNGRMVLEGTIDNPLELISLKNMASGIYFLHVNHEALPIRFIKN